MSLIGNHARTMRFLLGVAVASGAALFVGGQAWAASTDLHSVTSTETVLLNVSESTETVTEKSRDSWNNNSADVAETAVGGGPASESDTGSEPQQKITSNAPTREKLTAATSQAEIGPGDTADRTMGLQTAALSQTPSYASKDKASEPVVASVTMPLSVKVALADETAGPAVKQLWTAKSASPAGRATVVLPLQPTITNQAAAVSDLASAMPTLPTRKHGLPPTESTGLLSQLTMELAAVVPGLLDFGRIMTRMVPGLVADLNLLLLSVLVVAAAPSLFALWLRRSGFAGAARSDVPSQLIFATSFRLDYDSSETLRA